MKTCFLLVIFLLSFVLPHPVQAADQDTFYAHMDAQMPVLLAQYQVPGAVAAYIQDGAVAWTHAYGTADLRSGAAMQPAMLFNFGSCGKVLTAWGIMRLVDAGKLDLDAPANRYLKRWQITSTQWDANQVTVRRLLSHTAGLTVAGYSDYGAQRSLPGLVQVLNGANQSDGRVSLQWQPGSQFQYSGGGYAVLQMIIEDVSGETFDAYIQREVAAPLGLTTLQWVWTPGAVRAAAAPFGTQGEFVGYRQLAVHAVGSEIATVTDFARFIAAAVPGPNAEPAGRGVLKPATLQQMLLVQPATQGTEGLAYGIASISGDTVLMHFGSNAGWNAFFILDTRLRSGLVFASNSSNGFPLSTAIENLWTQTTLGVNVNVNPPNADHLGLAGKLAFAIAGLLGLPLITSLAWLLLQLRSGRRRLAPMTPSHLWWTLPPLLAALFWWDWIYAPFHSFLPPSFPDLWPIPQAGLVMGLLLAWLAYTILTAFVDLVPGAALAAAQDAGSSRGPSVPE